MGSINLKHTGSGSDIALSSDGTNLLLDGTAIGGGGGGADLYAANESSPTAQPSATGTNSIAIGDSAISTGTSSLAGPYSRASGYNSVAFGIQDTTTSYGSQSSGMAVGEKARNSANKSMAFGDYSVASGSNSAAHGRLASSGGIFAMAFGFNSSASHQRSTAIGNAASSHATSGVAIGGSGYSVKISGSYTLPTADGSANQVLTTNGSGVSSWAAAGGGSMNLISTQNISSAVSSIDFTSLGSYTRWKIIGSYKWSSGAIAALKLFDNGSLISGSQYSSYRTKDYDTPAIFNGSYGFLANNIGIQNASFIWDIIMVDGRPYVKMDTSGQTSSSHASQEQCNTSGMLVDSYSLTSLTGFSVTATGGTCNTGQISLYGIST